MKYRKYDFRMEKDRNGFPFPKLLRIEHIKKLPKNVKKYTGENKAQDVWVTSSEELWSKICRIESNIDFGTGKTEPMGDD